MMNRKHWRQWFVSTAVVLSALLWRHLAPLAALTSAAGNQQADEATPIPPAARGVAGLHGWVASDYFDGKDEVQACDAIYWRDTKRLASMIESGLDVNAQKQHGITLLHWAVACNSFECFKMLLEAGADPDVPLTKSIRSKDGPVYYGIVFLAEDTVLHTCSRLLWKRYLVEGLKFCNQPDQRGSSGQRIKDLLRATRGVAEELSLLFAAGADPNFSDSFGHSAFVSALIIGDYEAIRVLMKYHADPLFGNISSERILKLTDECIGKVSEGQQAPELALLKEFRQAVITRAEELKAEKASEAKLKAPE